ncbi:hypothetical protein [Pseudomonas sp. KNUC1026]|uniref:hypothetical protein n=1 Tax=Pseudomonas sp. KNUC1026 TaxID=2893890 RepID=UPI001F18EBD8|nr:hypothetical protein [Pseudomonas sp. KNUC1026]UFH49516.1 hypothetical protein LN139_22360 [Pseudomonas sp. KNUC1026]
MLSAQQASAIVLALFDGRIRDGQPERFVIQACELSAGGDYWVIRCNSEDYVVHGKAEYCYVGVNAHLIDVVTGEHESVASCFSVEEYLQDKHALKVAAGNSYVLCPAFSREDKVALLNLRRMLSCSYPEVFALLSGAGRQWLTGIRRHMEHIQRLLERQGVATVIELVPSAAGAVSVGPETWHIEAVLRALHKRFGEGG